MGKSFTLDFQVRDYELDQYGVVNNAVYLNYLEHTRHEFMLSIGVGPAALAASGQALTLAGINIRFRAPLRSQDRFQVELSISRLSGVRVELHQRILRLGELILEAWAEALFLNERGRPMRVPAAHRDGLRAYLADPEKSEGNIKRQSKGGSRSRAVRN
ncbi:MAG: thioesterase family protein [SAR324 cluster bacterium]|nr:thioesterase family protein [SAR324 cluster bacterium]